MKTITALKFQQRDKNKVNLFLDGKYFCALSTETVLTHNIKADMMVEEKIIENWQYESEKNIAYDKSLKLISTRYKTKKEVEEYLEQKGYLPQIIWYVIKKLMDYNFIDDERYVESYVSHHQKDGVNKIKNQLINKGIKRDIIENTMSKIDNQQEQIELLLKKYMKSKESTKQNYLKAYKYLIGRGFESDEILKVLKGENNDWM